MPFFIENKTIKVLVLVVNTEHYGRPGKTEQFDIPKGHVNKGESLVGAAHREIKEEIGIPLHIDTNFKETIQYSFWLQNPKAKTKTKVNKKAVYFVAFMNPKDRKNITLSEEHTKHYLMPISEAIEKAQHPNQKWLLEKAKEYITQNYLT